jgi:hypothetical protein
MLIVNKCKISLHIVMYKFCVHVLEGPFGNQAICLFLWECEGFYRFLLNVPHEFKVRTPYSLQGVNSV